MSGQRILGDGTISWDCRQTYAETVIGKLVSYFLVHFSNFLANVLESRLILEPAQFEAPPRGFGLDLFATQ